MPQRLRDAGTAHAACRSPTPQSPESFGALCLGAHRIGFIALEAARILLREGLAAPENDTLRLPDLGSVPQRTALLARVGDALSRAGLVPPTVGEALDLFALRLTPEGLEPVGAPLAQADRSLYRRLGALTQVVHLTAVREGAVVLGLRPKSKRIGPGLWDSLAAGMVRAGETPDGALRRETLEEAGIDVATLVIRTMPGGMRMEVLPGEGLLLEKTYRYATELVAPHRLTSPSGEVERYEAFTAKVLEEMIAEGRLMPEAAAGAKAVLRCRTDGASAPDDRHSG